MREDDPPPRLRAHGRDLRLGPGAGADGGESLALGVALKEDPREPTRWLKLRGASENNLAGVDVDIPTGVLAAVTCEVCEGKRFDDAVLVHTLGGKNIAEVLAMPAAQAQTYLEDNKVGLGYVTLGRPLTTLSGGERQRLKLAASLKKPAPAYVLAEPTHGLHLADTARLVELFDRLVDGGASVIDLAPGAGSPGGQVVATGSPTELVASAGETGSATGRYLAYAGDLAAREGSV